jgi:imidazolonepropionase-like amidohydrolase
VLRAKVDMLKYEHADLVKIFASNSIRDGGLEILTLHQLQVLCGEANRVGLRTLVHAYNGSVHNATVAGCTEVEHADGGTEADIDLIAQKGTYFDPQVGLVIQNYVRFKDKFFGNGDYNAAGFARMVDEVKTDDLIFNEARRAKAKLVMGTDAVAGGFGHQADEIIERIRLGQPAMDAIDDATFVNAESLRLDKQIGSIAAGNDADIIAVDGDPLAKAALLRQVSFVMKDGTVYKDTVSAGGR